MTVVLKNFTLTASEPPQTNVIDLPVTLVSLSPNSFKYFIDEIKGENGEVLVSFDKPKEFVPSFDQSKEGKVLILQYSNSEEDVPATISVVASVNLETHEVKISGFGFKEVNLVVEIPKHVEKDETHENSLPDSALPSKALEEGEDNSGEDLGK